MGIHEKFVTDNFRLQKVTHSSAIRSFLRLRIAFNDEVDSSLLVDWRNRSVFPIYIFPLSVSRLVKYQVLGSGQAENPLRVGELECKPNRIMTYSFFGRNFKLKQPLAILANVLTNSLAALRDCEVLVWVLHYLHHFYRFIYKYAIKV